MLPQLDVILMRSFAALKDENQLVLRAIETTLTGVRLHPDDNVFQFGIRRRSGRKKLADMSPIDEHEMDGRRLPSAWLRATERSARSE